MFLEHRLQVLEVFMQRDQILRENAGLVKHSPELNHAVVGCRVWLHHQTSMIHAHVKQHVLPPFHRARAILTAPRVDVRA